VSTTAATTTLTSLGVSVLALLCERPMHPYEMYRLLLDRHEDRMVKVRPGSLYHTVDRLADDALLAAAGTDRDGGRPERTIYRITPDGEGALRERIRTLLAVPVNEYPRFPVALAEAHNLPCVEVLDLLRARVERLDADLAEFDALLGLAAEHVTPEAYLLGGHYLREMVFAELGWLRRLVDRLERKELAWPHDNRL
jgi:DNA-binding PadR family transcriptional regulator